MQNASFSSLRAALLLAEHIRFSPDIVHHHEWQTGLISAYLKSIYQNHPFFRATASVFTIHNIAYQGLFKKEKFSPYGSPHGDVSTRKGSNSGRGSI